MIHYTPHVNWMIHSTPNEWYTSHICTHEWSHTLNASTTLDIYNLNEPVHTNTKHDTNRKRTSTFLNRHSLKQTTRSIYDEFISYKLIKTQYYYYYYVSILTSVCTIVQGTVGCFQVLFHCTMYTVGSLMLDQFSTCSQPSTPWGRDCKDSLRFPVDIIVTRGVWPSVHKCT